MSHFCRQVSVSLVFLGLLAAACTPAPVATPTPTADPVAVGRDLYVAKGCLACHGEAGSGTDLGPALPGHTEEQVLMQVRTPRGMMPSFGLDKISDEELAAISAYVLSLGPATAAHMHGEFEASAEEMDHLLLALSALGAENVADAAHHLDHLIAASEGEIREEFAALAADLQAGMMHDVEHDIEELVEASPSLGISPVLLHVELAVNALGREDLADAEHHLLHAIDISSGDERAKLQSLLADLQAGKEHDAEHEMEEMLAGMGG